MSDTVLKRTRRRTARAVSQLPNILTLMSLACGLTAVRVSSTASHRIAPILLLMGGAAICDALDGRVARLLDSTSDMGANLDSLCDAISFGVAPAFITYFLVIAPSLGGGHVLEYATVSWAAAIIYVGTIVLRLARFNTLLADEDRPDFEKEFFVGVPAPVSAWLALVPVVVIAQFGAGWWSHPLTVSIWLVVVGLLAFSHLPTLSGKTLKIAPSKVPGILIIALVLIAGMFTVPLYTILVGLVAYLGHIPYAMILRRRYLRDPQAWEQAHADDDTDTDDD